MEDPDSQDIFQVHNQDIDLDEEVVLVLVEVCIDQIDCQVVVGILDHNQDHYEVDNLVVH